VSISENDQESMRSQPCLIEELIDYFIEDVASGNDHVLAISEDGNDLFSWG
jgi:alpha-tubulin suppressor-like RCC1 family protein